MALLLAGLLAPAAAADDTAPWWAAAEPRPEPEYGWWAPPEPADIALQGAPDVSAAPAAASALLPSATQSLPSFAAAQTGPTCDAVTGECDAAASVEEPAAEDDARGAGVPENEAAGDGPAGETAPADDSSDAEGSAAPAASTAASSARERETPNSCHRYEKQIIRYLGELEYAKEQGNAMAAAALEAQIERLAARELKQCPHPPPKNQLAAMMRTLKKLGKLALTAAQYGLF
jgi:hypothetical protein